MTDLAQASARLAAAVSARQEMVDPARHGWLAAIRQAAAAAFESQGLPSRRDERWRYSTITDLSDRLFVPPSPADLSRLDRQELARQTLPGVPAFRLVFVDGHLVRELSSRAFPTARMTITSLVAALEAGDRRLAPTLSRVAGYLDQSLVALNTALFGDGALIALDPGTELEVPVHLVFFTSGQMPRAAVYPRVLISMAAHSRMTLIESFLGGPEPSFTNAVTELALGEGAELEHLRLQRQSGEAFTVASVTAHLASQARYGGRFLSRGSRLTRHEASITFTGPGAEATLDGLSLARGGEQIDHQTGLYHEAPACHSEQLFKAVIDDDATCIFNGAVVVAPGASGTNARQTNRNLLLSERASVNTKPQLEILNDDVQCAHGATVGQLDEQALFFLRARGIDRVTARQMLVRGFAGEWLERVPDSMIRDQLARVVYDWLAETTDGG